MVWVFVIFAAVSVLLLLALVLRSHVTVAVYCDGRFVPVFVAVTVAVAVALLSSSRLSCQPQGFQTFH